MATSDEVMQIRTRAVERAHSSIGNVTAPTSDLVIGIDFGTTFTGVAYAHSLAGNTRDISRTQAELSVIADKVMVIKSWPMTNMQISEKTPTVLAYENGELDAWGGRVRLGHQTTVQYFKLGLQEGTGNHYRRPGADDIDRISLLGGFLNDPDWRHSDLPNKRAVDYAGDYLRAVREYVLNTVLPRQLGTEILRNENISYALTVPAIWTDNAKDLTKRAAGLAGIPMENLVIITEPEAAALYCATSFRDVQLKEGDRFLICDAGGGTVVN